MKPPGNIVPGPVPEILAIAAYWLDSGTGTGTGPGAGSNLFTPQ